MALPVMEQVPARVLAQREAAYAALRGEGTETPDGESETPGTPVETPAPRPDPTDTPPRSLEQEPQAPAAAITPQQGEPPASAGEIQALSAELRRLADAFSTLQGKYNAELPRLNQALRERDEEIARLRKQAMQIPDPAEDLSDEQLKSAYGLTDDQLLDRDLLNTIRRISATDARKAAALAREAVREEVEPVRQQFERTAQQTFHERLVQTVPDFDQLNESKEFIAWLEGTAVPFTKTHFLDRLNEAYHGGDLKTVTEIVDAYRTATNKPGVKRPSVAAQVTPEPKANTRPADPRVTYTLEEYQGLASKLTKLTPGSVEYMKLAKEITNARLEGRIVPRR